MRFSEFSDMPNVPSAKELESARLREEQAAEQREIEQREIEERKAEQREIEERKAEQRKAEQRKAEQQQRDAEVKRASRLAGIRQDYDGRRQDQAELREKVTGLVESREGADRGDSLRKLDQRDEDLKGLRAEHEAAVREAGEPLSKDAKDQIDRFAKEIEDERAEVRTGGDRLRDEIEAEEAHEARIPDVAKISAESIQRTIVTHVCRAAAVALANHAFPGAGGHIVQGVETIIKGCKTIQSLDSGEAAVRVGWSLTTCDGLVELNIGTTLSDDDNWHDNPPLDVVLGPSLDGKADAPPDLSSPDVEVVMEKPGREAGKPPGQDDEPEEESDTETEREDDAEGTEDPVVVGRRSRSATGVVICGSARVLAATAKTRLLGVEVLVPLARAAILRKAYDRRPGSVAAAMRKVKDLEIVVFIDPEVGGGLWIDVNPATQSPATSLAIGMRISENGLEEFRLFQLSP